MSYQHKCPVLNHKTHLKVYSALKPPERLLRFCRVYKPPVDNKSARIFTPILLSSSSCCVNTRLY